LNVEIIPSRTQELSSFDSELPTKVSTHYASCQIIGDYNGLVKLIADSETHRLIGVHIVGEHASELIHTGQLLKKSGQA